jgi:hypothetical protein
MQRLIAAFIAIALTIPAVVACSDTGSCLEPIQTMVAAVAVTVRPPARGGPAPAQAACPIQVVFDGERFWDTGANSLDYHAWAVSEADLEPIGHATQATVGRAFREDTVYRINGIDPADAIAMHDGRSGGIAIFVRDANRFPDGLCRRVTSALSYPAVCPSPPTSS